MNILTDRDKDLFYSAMMLNTRFNYRTLKELTGLDVIRNYRDICDLDVLKSLSGKDSLLKPSAL